MGWASGSALMRDVIDGVMETKAKPKVREKLYYKLIQAFEDHDCDTLDECLEIDPAFDKAWQQLWDEYQEENDED